MGDSCLTCPPSGSETGLKVHVRSNKTTTLNCSHDNTVQVAAPQPKVKKVRGMIFWLHCGHRRCSKLNWIRGWCYYPESVAQSRLQQFCVEGYRFSECACQVNWTSWQRLDMHVRRSRSSSSCVMMEKMLTAGIKKPQVHHPAGWP